MGQHQLDFIKRHGLPPLDEVDGKSQEDLVFFPPSFVHHDKEFVQG